MPYVVTQSCCSDASCVLACPVNCIHPAPGEPGFATSEMLFVDPQTCVDCGACATACPVDALVPDSALTAAQQPFLELNAAYYRDDPHPERTPLALVAKQRPVAPAPVRVAVVGAGPAGLYAADELLKYPNVTVDVFDRLPTPHGLARAGVAPDHQRTKQISELFRAIEEQPGFRYRLDVEVGAAGAVSHADLVRGYHAVLYAVGAATDRTLDVPGEQLPGSVPATDFVAWYNGRPDHAATAHRLDTQRAVVVGNGNVALDVARILTADPDRLASTDISDRALAALRDSAIREVVVLGRRGPAEAAFTLPELIGLAGLDDVDVVVDGPVEVTSAKTEILAELAARPPVPGRRRIVLRFRAAPVRILGDDRVTGIEVAHTELRSAPDGQIQAVPTDVTEIIPAGLVLRAIGYRARPVPGLPFDERTATVPHDGGRVHPGVYVAGWIKRGPTGFIGTNKSCAEETVATLLDDLQAGLLTVESAEPQPRSIDLAGWRAVDNAERTAGTAAGRPRVKLVDRAEIRAAARPQPQPRRRVSFLGLG